MEYELPPWLSVVAPVAVTAVIVGVLLLAGKVPLVYNLRNLVVRWKTTLLTALAFTVVVALLVFMHAFASGITRLSQRSGQPANVICLADGATDELFSNLPLSETSDLARQEGVARDAENRPLCSREVYVFINQPLPVMQGDRPKYRFLQIRGVEEPDISAAVHGMELAEGDWFSTAGVRGGSAEQEQTSLHAQVEVVIGEGLARDLGAELQGQPLQVGATYELAERQCIVVGIMRGADTTFGSEVWAKRQKVAELFNKENIYTSIVLRATSPAVATELAERLSHEYKKQAVTALTEPEYFKMMGDANKQLLLDFFDSRQLSPEERSERFQTDDYTQHNPRFLKLDEQTRASGRRAWVRAYQETVKRGIKGVELNGIPLENPPVIIMAECDLVTAIYRGTLKDPDDPSRTYEAFAFETVRVRDGKFSEHWDQVTLAPGWMKGGR